MAFIGSSSKVWSALLHHRLNVQVSDEIWIVSSSRRDKNHLPMIDILLIVRRYFHEGIEERRFHRDELVESRL